MTIWIQSQWTGEVEKKATKKRYMFNIFTWGGEEHVIKELAETYCRGDQDVFLKEYRIIYDLKGKKVMDDDDGWED